ncbi:hypothetical protein A7D01_13510 [Xanthomonas arboricola]|nr:hypothetical protein A7D01_13510 [Xanthomonas arboricola]
MLRHARAHLECRPGRAFPTDNDGHQLNECAEVNGGGEVSVTKRWDFEPVDTPRTAALFKKLIQLRPIILRKRHGNFFAEIDREKDLILYLRERDSPYSPLKLAEIVNPGQIIDRQAFVFFELNCIGRFYQCFNLISEIAPLSYHTISIFYLRHFFDLANNKPVLSRRCRPVTFCLKNS